MKTVAINQSNYVPWIGYFNLIKSADIFVIYDSVQYTKNDWRNRNQIKAPNGVIWLTVPTGSKISRSIDSVLLPEGNWRRKHLATLEQFYKKSRYFDEIFNLVDFALNSEKLETLSQLNITLITLICQYLNIKTKIISDQALSFFGDKNTRLLQICTYLDADIYRSAPAAKTYLDIALFAMHGIDVVWHKYPEYPAYPQLWGPFCYKMSILDLLFNCGPSSANFI